MTNIRKRISSLLSLMIAVLITMSVGILPAFAETSVVGTTVNLTSTINVTNDTVAPPETTMNYSITPGVAVPGSAGKLPIYAGIGDPTITPSVTFTASDYTTGTSPIAKTASKDVTVDFSSVTFTRTGIYRYVVTQTTSNTIDYMQYASNRYIDVYVTTDGTALSATYVVIDATNSTKGNDFTNIYPVNPTSVTITNIVAGNQRELDKDFNYVLTISSNNTITVTKTDIDGIDTALTLTDGEYTFSLKGTEYVTIDGLTDGNTYRAVQESEEAEGYTTTYQIGTDPAVEGLDTGVITVAGTADDVVFTNTRDSGTPTGVATTTTPYIAMLLVAGAFVVFMITKRKREEYEI